MNLFELNKELKLQKTVRVLIYPNITFQEDLEKDSYIQVIKNQIKLLNEIRDDLWFYLILTKPMESLQFDNVTQLYSNLPTYPPTMRSHFEVPLIQKMLNERIDIDLVMTHLPEHAHALKSVLYNVTHHIPPFMGYCHWFDVKEVVAWPKDSFLQNITGLLEYKKCYLNTKYQKNLVLNQAANTFNSSIITELDKILTPQHLGVKENDIVENINNSPEKIIVFNHRPDTYKHFKQFISLCDSLWKKRKDFKVWIPLLDKSDREYVLTDSGDKNFYYNFLQRTCVGFSPKQKYGGWSVSTTDGMMNGVPYIMYDAGYYHELYEEGDFFSNDIEAEKLLNKYLDDSEYRNSKAKESLEWIKNNLIYKDEMKEMSNYMDDLISQQKTIQKGNRLNDIIQHIRKNGSITKSKLMLWLNWGRGIKWSPYRLALLNHPNIYDVNDGEPTYFWKD